MVNEPGDASQAQGAPPLHTWLRAARSRSAACRDATGQRWVITGWAPIHRIWLTPPVPCLHADPSFPDCPPGQTVTAYGILSYYEGNDVKQRIRQLRAKYFPAK